MLKEDVCMKKYRSLIIQYFIILAFLIVYSYFRRAPLPLIIGLLLFYTVLYIYAYLAREEKSHNVINLYKQEFPQDKILYSSSTENLGDHSEGDLIITETGLRYIVKIGAGHNVYDIPFDMIKESRFDENLIIFTKHDNYYEFLNLDYNKVTRILNERNRLI